eukprot:22583-Chlamydomonas_euryale.AAC.1
MASAQPLMEAFRSLLMCTHEHAGPARATRDDCQTLPVSRVPVKKDFRRGLNCSDRFRSETAVQFCPARCQNRVSFFVGLREPAALTSSTQWRGHSPPTRKVPA